ncbi:MAG: CPBP family intramembrane metalloprotease [Candidatus Hydrogenedentes bacterium]|nr:CPBP family intramembrane metalloprotease [Candidatus Hydrogenedentota bacterium]
MAEIIFWSMLAVHVGYSLIANRWEPGKQPTGTVRFIHVSMQGPLLWSAAYIGWHMGVFSRDLVSPVYIGLGLAAGHVVFGFSILATHLSWRDAWAHFFDFGPIWNFTMDSPSVLTRFIGVAFAEELIWRVVGQTLAIGLLATVLPQPQAVAVAIGAMAIAFVVVHKHFFENTWYVSLEFIAFSVLIGAFYHWTQSFIMVIVIHAMRDIEIAYLEYLEKVEELGDETQAAHAIDQAYRAHRLEKV